MEDIKLGRELAPMASQVRTDGLVPILIAAADPARTRLTISGDGLAVVHVGPKGITLGLSRGFTLPATGLPWTLRVEEWGRLVAEEWYAYTDTATAFVTVAVSTLERY